MARCIASVTIRFETPKPELTDDDDIDERIEQLIWDGFHPLVLADVVTEVSHVEVDVQPEE